MAPPSAPNFRSLFENSPNAYMVLDRDLRYVSANPAYLKLTASRLEDILGQYVFAAFPDAPDDPAAVGVKLVKGALEGALNTGKAHHLALVPYRVPKHTPTGIVVEERLWTLSHFPIADEAGTVTHVAQLIEDVTELVRLKQAAESGEDSLRAKHGLIEGARRVQDTNVALDRELRSLRTLFDQAPGFFCWLSGPTHVFQMANSAYLQLVGHRDLVGKAVLDAIPEVRDQGFVELLDQVYSTRTPFVGRGVPIKLQRQPGGALEEAFLDFVYQPVVERDGSVSGIFVEGNDRTEEVRLARTEQAHAAELARLYERERGARAEAEEANRLKDEFLATVSHELRTPLTAMLGWVQLLRAGHLPEDKASRALETIERNARSQSQIIEDLLDIARITSGKLKLEIETLEAASAFEAAIESVRPAMDAKNLRLSVALDSSVSVRGDAARLQQIAWNLLSNAVKFTPKGGRIWVSLERTASSAELVVRDSGEGIATDFLPHVFERFRQQEGSTARSHGGLGLGLAIVKHLAELHGGTVSAESEGEEKGSTFRVRLPVAATRRAELTSPGPRAESVGGLADFQPPAELKGLRILVVDDESDTRELIQTILERCGCRVEVAGSVAEAMPRLESFQPQMLLSDIGMPGEDGYDLIRRIREHTRQSGRRIPAIALTAYARSEDRTRALRAGFMAHVPKPVEPAELVAVLAALAPLNREG